jgi:hypothetical protein
MQVEDMLLLLADVQRRFPEVQGVCCGAILSTYQRLRLEDVCARLGLQVRSKPSFWCATCDPLTSKLDAGYAGGLNFERERLAHTGLTFALVTRATQALCFLTVLTFALVTRATQALCFLTVLTFALGPCDTGAVLPVAPRAGATAGCDD